MEQDVTEKYIQINGKEAIFNCGRCLQIHQIATQYEALRKLLTMPLTSIILEGGALQKIDTASIQLLLSFMKAAVENNYHCQWGSVSDVLLRNGTILGMQKLLCLKPQET